MSLQLQIINIPEGELLAETLYRMPSAGGLIGRSPDCTVALPDNTRTLSGKHARIYPEDNHWLIEDLSTNGLLVNNASAPLGPGKRHTLTDGDILTCGEYRIMVNLFSPEISLTSGPETHSDTEYSSQDNNLPDDPFASSAASVVNTGTAFMDDPFELSPGSQPNQHRTDKSVPDADDMALSFDNATRPLQPLDELANEMANAHSRQESLIDVLDNSEAMPDQILPEQTSQDSKISPLPPSSHETAVDIESPVLNPAWQSDSVNNTARPEPVHVAAMPVVKEVSQQMVHEPATRSELSALLEENRRLREALRRRSRVLKKMMYHAMGEALEQTLTELSPEYLEKLFDDYNGGKPGLFGKRDNWKLYTRHYQRIMKEQTLRLTFTARFQAAMNRLKEKSS
ncbi:type VI secretion system-associated FHA domain protein [Endozoicomonadaceae bacterium StTr2]